MAFLYLVTIFTLASLTTAQYVGYQAANIQTQPSLSKVLQVPEYVQESSKPQISYTLQLPKIENPVLFYNPEISEELKPPSDSYDSVPSYYVYPVPSQDLQVPPVGQWNPNNDPSLYYDNVVDLINSQKPTNLYPKKFNKETHEKIKQYQPKQEIEINPLTVGELTTQLKVNDKLEKHENRKQLRNEKVPKATHKLKNKKVVQEPQSAASENFNHGLSSSITAPLGIHASPGERLEFHMHGHEGPNSYKWGFDTGKGRNRQFRFEERDHNGHVKGQYGYYDKAGKLHVYHYDAHPEEGFHAESNTDKQ